MNNKKRKGRKFRAGYFPENIKKKEEKLQLFSLLSEEKLRFIGRLKKKENEKFSFQRRNR